MGDNVFNLVENIKQEFGLDTFFSLDSFCKVFNVERKDGEDLFNYGVAEGPFIETKSMGEFAFKENPKEEEIKNFNEFAEKNFSITLQKITHLNLEETNLRDKVLQNLALRRKSEASEDLVKHVLKKNNLKTLRDDLKNEVWIYEAGIYIPQGESFTKEYCRRILGSAYTSQFVNNVLEKIRADTFIDGEDFFKEATKNKEEIPVLNGILNIFKKSLGVYNPNKTFFSKINAEFNPNADCLKIKSFLKEILKNPEDEKIVFEIIGTTLYKKYFPQISIIFLGDGENGKGVLGNLIRTFLGEKNCCSLPLSQLTPDSFSVEQLFSKHANITGDVGNQELKDTGRFKELTSGTDLITAKRKFQRDLFFENYATLIFGLNELPRVYDFTHGFWRRWLILEFPYQFLKKSEFELRKKEKNVKLANPEIISELTTKKELSGLLNEALKGLERVFKNKQFSYTKSTAEIKDFWIRKSDSFTAFCMDSLEENPDCFISKKDLRKCFKDYCRKYKIKGTSDRNIKAVLEDRFGVVESRKTTHEGFDNVWEGIRFKQGIRDINGFSTYRGNGDLPIGSNMVDMVDNGLKKIK